jgi:hypothetical protein
MMQRDSSPPVMLGVMLLLAALWIGAFLALVVDRVSGLCTP